VSEGRAEALLREQAVTAEQRRSACVTLAGRALAVADGDKTAAKRMLREVLEAIGVIWYEPGVTRTPIGSRSHAAKRGERK